MATSSASLNDPRRRIVWVGNALWNRAHEFSRRELVLEYRSIEKALDDPATTRGIVLVEAGSQRRRCAERLAAVADALDHGIAIYGLAVSNRAAAVLTDCVKAAGLYDDVTIRTNPPEYEVAEKLARHKPGPPFNPAVAIKLGHRASLPARSQLFLRRAFFDCEDIAIENLSGGRSATVFAVHARFKDSEVGPRPLPFFAKIDKRSKIETEREKYRSYAEHFIPFNLRPNLDRSRSFSGRDHGVIVGNFVGRSEPLIDVAKRGHAQAALFSLFDNTLRGWRLQAKERTGNIIGAQELKPHLERLRELRTRVGKARGLGAQRTPTKLLETLTGLKPRKYLDAPMHGDLNPFNVRVRGSDAILIDLANACHGPLVADPAALEIGLAFEDDGSGDLRGWSKLMDTMSQEGNLRRAPDPAREPKPREWLWSAIRQLRVIAFAEELEPLEYATSLAGYLFRRASYRTESSDDEFRRTYAYVLADRLATLLSKV